MAAKIHMNYATPFVGTFGNFAEILAHTGTNILALLKTWQSRADQRGQLLELDADRLDDLGMSRAQAEREGRKPFWNV